MAYDCMLSDMQIRRLELEKAITALIHEFENETGVRVTEVQIGRMRYIIPSSSQAIRSTLTTAEVVVVL